MSAAEAVDDLSDVVQLRPMAPADVPFIFASWLKSYRKQAAGVPNGRYYANQHERIGKLLERGQVLVACNRTEPEQIFGYVVHEKPAQRRIVHFVYVKHAFRRVGIARLLAESLGDAHRCHYTHHTPAGAALALAFAAHFNPESLP